jgi:oxalate---CoA ligase
MTPERSFFCVRRARVHRPAACGVAGVPYCVIETNAGGFVRMGKSSVRETAWDPSPDDVALILHTSGSTGIPKRVLLTHRNIAASSPTDVSFCAMPLFHVHGLIASALSTSISGRTVVVPGKFNPLTFWRPVRETRSTWYSGVPMIHNLLLAGAGGCRPAGAEGLRFIRSCSAALPAETMQQME